MIIKFQALLFLLASQFILVNQAISVTVDNIEYEPILTLETSDGGIGYWKSMQKYYTSAANSFSEPTSLKVNSTETFFPLLSNFEVNDVSLMGTTRHGKWKDTVKTGELRLNDSNGEALLTADYIKYTGTLETVPKKGDEGLLTLDGLFTVTGGSLFQDGILDGQLRANFAFFNGVSVWENDFGSGFGRITILAASTPTNEVPEPTTATLLLAGLMGLGKNRKHTKRLKE